MRCATQAPCDHLVRASRVAGPGPCRQTTAPNNLPTAAVIATDTRSYHAQRDAVHEADGLLRVIFTELQSGDMCVGAQTTDS